MNLLLKMQAEFAGAVLGHIDEGADYGISPDGLSALRRIQVYKNNVYASLTQALNAIYPVVNRLVGDEFFYYIAKQYIPLHPSTSGNLHDFGGCFPLFIKSLQALEPLPYLSDVASLEWAYHQAFHGAHAMPLDLERLQKLPAQHDDALCFKLHPTCRLLKSDYPVLKIWQCNQESYEGDGEISLDQGGGALAVIRPELEIEFHLLSAGDFMLLNAIKEGELFYKACERAVEVEPDMDIAASLHRHIQNKIIVDFFLGNKI